MVSQSTASSLGRAPRRVSGSVTQPLPARPSISFRRNADASVAMIFAFAAPVFFLMAAAIIDLSRASKERELLQKGADIASLAAAKQLSLADRSRENTSETVEAVVENFLKGSGIDPSAHSVEVKTTVFDAADTPLQVEVKASKISPSLFAGRFGLGETRLSVQAVATIVGKPNICVLALDPADGGTILLQKLAKVVGQNCAIYSNSTHSSGIKSYDSSSMSASMICSAGGKLGGKGSFSPEPYVDCPQFEDPLAERPEPSAGACAATNLVINNQTTALSPGTYCGGISISGLSTVTFASGVYIMKDGPLNVIGSSTIQGVGVGFYFNTDDATFTFDTGTTIELSAPKTGEMAGLLFFGSRSQNKPVYKIFSDHARQLLGTIYLPRGEISIDANQPIADQSAYTAIVARKLTANSGPTVMLNTNYDASDVPVPDGIRGAGMPVALTR